MAGAIFDPARGSVPVGIESNQNACPMWTGVITGSGGLLLTKAVAVLRVILAGRAAGITGGEDRRDRRPDQVRG